MYKYRVRKLRDIAENYEEYSPEAEYTDWEQMCSNMEFKADFDTAFDKLDIDEKRFILKDEMWSQYYRDKAFRKMVRFLNGVETR